MISDRPELTYLLWVGQVEVLHDADELIFRFREAPVVFQLFLHCGHRLTCTTPRTDVSSRVEQSSLRKVLVGRGGGRKLASIRSLVSQICFALNRRNATNLKSTG